MPRFVFILSSLMAFLPCYGELDREFFDLTRHQRRIEVHTVKGAVASFDERLPVSFQGRNGDEARYSDKRGSFGKALRHLPSGFLDVAAFDSLVRALQSGDGAQFLRVQLGSDTARLVNPQACFAYTLCANDSWIQTMPPAPAFASEEAAAEMVEVYWTALVRNVPFNQFDSDQTVLDAISNLNSLNDFTGPKIDGMVTPQTFLRGNGPGELVGPYISQFLYQTIPYGSTEMGPEQKVPKATGNDFLTTYQDWLTVENGGLTGDSIEFDDMPHFLRTPRDLGQYVHVDNPMQEGYNAMRLLLSYGPDALDPANPYSRNPTQEGFVTFGEADITALIAMAVEAGLKAAWYQKWQVHRRVRPEEYGFYVQKTLADQQDLQIAAQLLNSPALEQIHHAFGSYFLPQAYPEGCPSHPSYPAGHATFIGAVVTVLKAFFDEQFVIPEALQPDDTNTQLIPYTEFPLTVGGELNKLASNVALGRDHAGVHYRSDGTQGILLGEKIAIDLLNNCSFLFHEDFSGYTLTTFGGMRIRVGGKREP